MISIVVPFRGSGERARSFDFVRSHMFPYLPEAEWVVSPDDGTDPFWKTYAVNRGVEQASSDVLLLLDSDTWVSPADVLEAEAAIRTRGLDWMQPWRVKYKLKPDPSAAVLELGLDWTLEGTDLRFSQLEHRNSYWAAPPLMFSRAAWEIVGGLDERLRGWGGEDDCFMYALKALAPAGGRTRGPAIHLWHPRRGRSGSDLWDGQTPEDRSFNRSLVNLYRAASKDARLMRIVTAGTREREVVGVG